MKKVIILVSLILLLLAGIDAYSQEPSPPVTKGQVQPREFKSEADTGSNINAQNNDNGTPKAFLLLNKNDGTHGSDAKPQKADKENGNSQTGAAHDDSITTYTWWMMIFTAALVGCNILLWLYTVKIAKATKAAADAAKRSADSLSITERANLFVDSIEWIKESSGINVAIINVGRTPAILRSYIVDVKENEYPTKEEVARMLAPDLPKGIIIKSDDPAPYPIVMQNITAERISEIVLNQSTLLCYGYVRYEDVFGNIHETGFCYEFFPGQSHGRFHISNNKDLNYHTYNNAK